MKFPFAQNINFITRQLINLDVSNLLLFFAGRRSEKNPNKFSKFDRSKAISCRGHKKTKFTNLASCVPWRNNFEIRGVLSLGSRIDSRNLSTIVLDKIQRGLWIFNKFESFRFAKGRHVVVFTILIRKSVKMDGVNVIDTIRQLLRNFLWFLLLSSSRHVFTNFMNTNPLIISPIFLSWKIKPIPYRSKKGIFSQFWVFRKPKQILHHIW